MNARFSKYLLSVVLIVVVVLGAGRVPLVRSQGESNIAVNLTPYEGNPVLNAGDSGSWDGGLVIDGDVVFHEDLYHMFYTGVSTGWSFMAVGYATSPDGLTWEKHAANPVFAADGTGFDALAVDVGAVLVEGDTWVLYYMAYRTPTALSIGRATAQSPSGPWARDEDPVLTSGNTGEWDAKGIYPASVIPTDEGYVMYYIAGDFTTGHDIMIGLATSPDGNTWTKYDDPTTTDPPFSESDPVLRPGFEKWQMVSIMGCVRQAADEWEMFYAEKGTAPDYGSSRFRLGYATSADGVHWTKQGGFPLVDEEDYPSCPEAMNDLRAQAVVVNDSTYFLYYDYGLVSPSGIGVATGTVARE